MFSYFRPILKERIHFLVRLIKSLLQVACCTNDNIDCFSGQVWTPGAPPRRNKPGNQFVGYYVGVYLMTQISVILIPKSCFVLEQGNYTVLRPPLRFVYFRHYPFPPVSDVFYLSAVHSSFLALFAVPF